MIGSGSQRHVAQGGESSPAPQWQRGDAKRTHTEHSGSANREWETKTLPTHTRTSTSAEARGIQVQRSQDSEREDGHTGLRTTGQNSAHRSHAGHRRTGTVPEPSAVRAPHEHARVLFMDQLVQSAVRLGHAWDQSEHLLTLCASVCAQARPSCGAHASPRPS